MLELLPVDAGRHRTEEIVRAGPWLDAAGEAEELASGMQQPARSRVVGARSRRELAARRSSPSGSSRPTRPGTGCRTWFSQPAARTSPGCPASLRTGCAGPDVAEARARGRRPRALRLRPRPARSRRSSRSISPLTSWGRPHGRRAAVFAVDANATFSRPGPRVVDGVELLAYLLHPGEYPDPGVAWSRMRL